MDSSFPSEGPTKRKPVKLPLPVVLIPIVILLGPLLMGIVFIGFALINMSQGNKIASSDINPIHQGPSELLFYLFIFSCIVAGAVLVGVLIHFFQKNRQDPTVHSPE